MKNIFFLLSLGLLSHVLTHAQNAIPDPTPFAQTITTEELRTYLNVLAADEFEGREIGTEGGHKAGRYIAKQFQQMGLPTIGEYNSYFQQVPFRKIEYTTASFLHINGKKFRDRWDFVTFPFNSTQQLDISTKEVLFLGYGIDDEKYSDYARRNVKDKVLLIYKGEPVDKKGNSYLTGNRTRSEWTTDPYKKLTAAYTHGAKAILIIENELQNILNENRSKIIEPTISLGTGQASKPFINSCYISTNVARALLGRKYAKRVYRARDKIRAKGKPKCKKVKSDIQFVEERAIKSLVGENVLGYIEGIDPTLKNELIVITAHYDHLGKRGDDIFNGADDNASGTSTALEVTEAFLAAKEQGVGPRRSILVMLVTGEEKGLLGSAYYAENPIFPLSNTVANINIDMVGRVDDRHENSNYVYVIGSDRLSTELHEINERVNSTYTKFELDYTYNAKDDPNQYYYRSDHYSFAERGIRAIFYFNGSHADYHRPSDTAEKIDFDKMVKLGKLVFYTAWELANRQKRIEVDVEQD